MDVDFIKWMVGYADGYMIIEDKIFYGGCYFTDAEDLWSRELHRYNLLQRAIEGVNTLTDVFLIYQDFSEIRLEHNICDDFEKYFSFDDYGGVDKAKESALKYIYEQECNNDNT